MPDKPLEIALNMTAKDLYDANPEYKAFQEADAQPMGVTFQGYDFPRYKEPTVIIKYPNGELSIDGEPPRLYRRVIYLSQAAMPDRIKLS